MTVRLDVPAALEGERLDRVIAMLTGRSRGEVAELVAGGAVCVDGVVATGRSVRVAREAVIEVALPEAGDQRPEPEDVAFEVVHEEEAFAVVEKPPGLVVHPGAGVAHGTLANGLVARYPELLSAADLGDPRRPGIVHRLDAGTSGLLVVARTAPAYAALTDQLRRRAVERRYLALVVGAVEATAGVVDAPVGRGTTDRTRMAVAASGRTARTHYRVRERFGHAERDFTLLECRLETGRTHQIRVHMAAIGHPVAADGRYGDPRGLRGLDRPFLHAYRLAFGHPITGVAVSFEAPLPADLATVLSNLRQ